MRLLHAILFLLHSGTAAALTCYASGFTKAAYPHCFKVSKKILVYSGKQGDYLKLGMQVADHDAWSSLAFSGNGGMKGARTIVVRKESGSYIAEDRYSVEYTTPELAATQDVQLIFASLNFGTTSWAVLIPMDSCKGMSKKDTPTNYPVLDISQKMLWALGSSHTFGFHGYSAKTRSSFETNLLSGPATEPSTAGAKIIELKMNNVEVKTTRAGEDPKNPYVCTVHDLHQYMDANQKHHVVKIEPVLDPVSEKYCHHMLFIVCDYDLIGLKHNKIIKDCTGMPEGCYAVKYPWAIGSKPMVFPADVGLPLGNKKNFVVVQFHYYMNPVVSGVRDNSGVRLYLAPSLRPIDAGMAFLNGGANSNMRAALPPGQKAVVNNMTVPSVCTSGFSQDLTVLSTVYHGHLVGSYFDISVRRNNKYVGSLRHENGYDFQHQSLQESPTKTIKKGDELHLHCQYDTSGKSTPTEFGDYTQTEMCVAFVAYYPHQGADSFSYIRMPPGYTQSQAAPCNTAGTKPYDDVSPCVQRYMENIFKFYDPYRDPEEKIHTAMEACGKDFFPHWQKHVPQGCPDCWKDNSCNRQILIAHATTQCTAHCAQYGLSLWPDTSKPTPRKITDAVKCGEHGKVHFLNSPVVKPPQCQTRGQNLAAQAAKDVITAAAPGNFSEQPPEPTGSDSASKAFSMQVWLPSILTMMFCCSSFI